MSDVQYQKRTDWAKDGYWDDIATEEINPHIVALLEEHEFVRVVDTAYRIKPYIAPWSPENCRHSSGTKFMDMFICGMYTRGCTYASDDATVTQLVGEGYDLFKVARPESAKVAALRLAARQTNGIACTCKLHYHKPKDGPCTFENDNPGHEMVCDCKSDDFLTQRWD